MPNINMEAIEYIRNIPPPFRAIIEELRSIIFNSIPDITENFKDNMPIYEKNGAVCFIQKEPKQHVVLGFYKGKELSDTKNLLEGADNKKKYIIITNIEDINKKVLFEMIREAVSLNQ